MPKNEQQNLNDRPTQELGLRENEKQLYEISFLVKQVLDTLEQKLCQEYEYKKNILAFVGLQNKLKEIWPDFSGSRNKPTFNIPRDNFPVGVASITLVFSNESSEASKYQGKNGLEVEIRVPLKQLIEAKSEQDIKDACLFMGGVLFHEVEHVLSDGAELDSTDPEDILEYLTNPGEIRAHAKEYAYLYYSMYPGEEFDMEKMKLIIDSNEQGITKTIPQLSKIKNYLIKFSQNETQEKYKRFADLGAVYSEITQLIAKFVSEMNEWQKGA